jgi:glycine/D-amino acid oxidase-like deaminating enzyme
MMEATVGAMSRTLARGSVQAVSGSLVVVGAGVFGASLARQCALSGWDVTLVERVAPGHVRAGSGGESRLIRCAHGDDAWHARSAHRALAMWHELDPSLVVECGVVWFARRTDGWEAASERVLTELGIACERVDPAELFPSVATDDLAFALFEPEAGILRARDATRVLAQEAVAAGARLEPAAARPDGAAVVLDDGRRLEADRIVWACGAWLPALVGDVVTLRITQQDVFFFGADARWTTPPVPGWVDYDGAAYGLGDLDGRGVKVAPDVEGPAFEPEHGRRVVRPEHERLACEYVAHRFPNLGDAPLVGTRVCQYELTPDSAFLAAPHPDHDGRVWLLGGGSGHGFKHGPALAEHVERWIAGLEPPNPRFALGPRVAARSLRTAGTPAP